MAVNGFHFGGVLLLLCFSSTIQAQVFDVTKYGAAGPIQQAALNAWKAACASTTPSKVLIPKGTYTLGEVVFEGPCKAPVEFVLQGTVLAPADPKQFRDGWVIFRNIDKLTISGGGTFDGQGKLAWGGKICKAGTYCKQLPINLSFTSVTNSIIKDVRTKDSKQFHVNVLSCNNVTFQGFTVLAPADSPNTDGIHIGRSTGINVVDSHIYTGDDCVSLGDGNRQITVTGVVCGPGHGISVGSLGKFPNEGPVVGFTVKNCTLSNTQNGVRVKTWPASYRGFVSDMHFEDIIMNNVGNPIIIDQIYCPWNQCNAKVPSQVKISNVSFKNIRGTSATQVAVKLSCSRSVPCENVELRDINLQYSGPQGHALSACSNVKPNVFGVQNPPACTTPADNIPSGAM